MENVVGISYPLRVGTNGDICVSLTSEESIRDEIKLVLDNHIQTIAGFPTIGNPFMVFDNMSDELNLYVDQLVNILYQAIPQIKKIYNINTQAQEDHVFRLHFDYTTHDGAVNHYSSNHWMVKDV